MPQKSQRVPSVWGLGMSLGTPSFKNDNMEKIEREAKTRIKGL